MPADTFSDSLGAILQGTGNNNNNWGVLLNTAITLFDKAVAGKSERTVTGGTLDLDGTTPPAGAHELPEMIVYFTGTLASNQIVLVPNVPKVWLVYNGTSGDFTLTFKTASGDASTPIPQGSWQWIACDGDDAFALIGPGSDATGKNFKVLPTVNGSAIVPIGGSIEYEGILEPTGWLFKFGQAVSRETYELLFEAITTTITATKNGTTTLSNVLSFDANHYGLVGAYVEGTGVDTGTTIVSATTTTLTLSAAVSGSGTQTFRILPHGQGDASTTFNIPDDRGRVTVGRDNMGGTSANRMTGTTGSVNGDNFGATGGSETHTLTTAQTPTHSHTATDGGHTHSASQASHAHATSNIDIYGGQSTGTSASGSQSAPLLGISLAGVSTGSATPAITVATGAASISVSSVGSGAAHNNVQPSIVKNKIIFTGLI